MLCIGDLMLDEFVYGEVARISPEAPAPVIAVRAQRADDRRRRQCGAQSGRARRALHLHRRGRRRRCRARAQARRWPSSAASTRSWWSTKARRTTRKVRFVSEHFSTHLLRADWEAVAPVDAKIEAALIGHVAKAMPKSRRGGAVRLRQGRADPARDARRDRRREKSRQAGDRRSQGPRLQHLSRRHLDHAEPAGTRRRHAQRRRDRRGRSATRRRRWRARSAPRPCW